MGVLDTGKPDHAQYLDIKKAFDTVPHSRLINTFKGYGIRGNLLSWINEFLSNRTQYVKLNNEVSENNFVTIGVPQRSFLGPILFIYYINDMPEIVDCDFKIFADGTKA